MKNKQLLNWIERLVDLKAEYDNCGLSQERQRVLLARLLGYVESAEFIIKQIKKEE